ncbi:MAG: YesL family protein, partial [Clostridiales bacterium]|nr:YesL family protein [Clostridiales bacterium]
MAEMFRGFLSNDSAFGRLMTRLGIIIAANIMFAIFSLPVVTIGASYVALYHVMFKTLRGDGVINPFKQFWIGFKTNF